MKKNTEETWDSIDMTLELVARELGRVVTELKRMNDRYKPGSPISFDTAANLMKQEDDFH
jgi:hypothetical protein